MLKPDLAQIVKETNDKKPFAEFSGKWFFTRWCDLNGNIRPSFYPRSLIKDTNKLVEKSPDGSILLNLPDDIKTPELIYYLNELENLSISPKLREKSRTKQLQEVAKKIENTAIYINQRLPCLEAGQEAARALAEEFFTCANLWKNQLTDSVPKSKTENNSDLKKTSLSEAEVLEIDQWLLGKKNYETAIEKLNKDLGWPVWFRPEHAKAILKQDLRQQYLDEQEKARLHYLKLFFDYALQKNPHIYHDPEKPWIYEPNLFAQIQEDVSRKIKKLIQSPELELLTAVYEDGKEELKANLNVIKKTDDFREKLRQLTESLKLTKSSGAEAEIIGYFSAWVKDWLIKHPADSEDKKTQAVKIEKLLEEAKINLPQDKNFGRYGYITRLITEIYDYTSDDKAKIEILKQDDYCQKTKTNLIVLKEMEVVGCIYSFIKDIVDYYDNEHEAETTSYLGQLSYRPPDCNCASDLMSSYLEDAGIRYIKAYIPGHTFLLIVLSDGEIFWFNTVEPFSSGRIKPQHIFGINFDQLTEFIEHPSDEGLVIGYNDPAFLQTYAYAADENGEIPYVFLEDQTAANPAGLLHNFSIDLHQNTDKNELKIIKEESLKQSYLAARYSAQFAPSNPSINSILAHRVALLNKTQTKEDIMKIIKFDPEEAYGYWQLSEVLLSENKPELAEKVLQEGSKFDKDGLIYYGLGKNSIEKENFDEAINYFTIAVGLNPTEILCRSYLFFTYLKINQIELAVLERINGAIDLNLNPYKDLQIPYAKICYYLAKIYSKKWLESWKKKITKI